MIWVYPACKNANTQTHTHTNAHRAYFHVLHCSLSTPHLILAQSYFVNLCFWAYMQVLFCVCLYSTCGFSSFPVRLYDAQYILYLLYILLMDSCCIMGNDKFLCVCMRTQTFFLTWVSGHVCVCVCACVCAHIHGNIKGSQLTCWQELLWPGGRATGCSNAGKASQTTSKLAAA